MVCFYEARVRSRPGHLLCALRQLLFAALHPSVLGYAAAFVWGNIRWALGPHGHSVHLDEVRVAERRLEEAKARAEEAKALAEEDGYFRYLPE